MPDPRARRISDEHAAIVEQALLNMILREDITIFRRGVDITESCLSQAERINKNYDENVEPRNKPATVIAKPSSVPRKSEPKPPRARRITSHAASKGKA